MGIRRIPAYHVDYTTYIRQCRTVSNVDRGSAHHTPRYDYVPIYIHIHTYIHIDYRHTFSQSHPVALDGSSNEPANPVPWSPIGRGSNTLISGLYHQL